MIYIVINIVMILVGVIGIIKMKVPKFDGSPGFAAMFRLYVSFYVLLIMGIIFLILEIKEKINEG